MREIVPDKTKEILLLMDGGGGTYLHISPELSALCLREGVRIFLIPPYGTKALCALDQDVHKHIAAEWAQFKACWAAQHGTLNVYQALSACSNICAEALSQQRAATSYRMIGLEPGKKINVDRVVSERATELFSNLKSQGHDVPQPKAGRKRIFDLVATVSPPKVRCQKCQKTVTVVDQFCRECGAANNSFDTELHDIHRSGKRSGWAANAEWLAKQKPQNEVEEQVFAKTGDFLKKIRQKTTTTPSLPQTPSMPSKVPSTPALPDPSAAPSTPAPAPSTPAAATSTAAATDLEYDLENVDDCTKLIVRHFGPGAPQDLHKIALFYVQDLKSKSTKSISLSNLVHKEVLKGGLFRKKDGRQQWLSSWRHNRALRYVALPDYLKS